MFSFKLKQGRIHRIPKVLRLMACLKDIEKENTENTNKKHNVKLIIVYFLCKEFLKACRIKGLGIVVALTIDEGNKK